MVKSGAERIWHVRTLENGYEWDGPLVASWEAFADPISDDYTPAEIGAADLLRKWAKGVSQQFPTGLVPIYWSVASPGQGKRERMPFQQESKSEEHFLTFYTWPVDARTGERLNWLSLPVEDKLWNENRHDKGGFIQEATGWIPSILQPHLYLPALLSTLPTE